MTPGPGPGADLARENAKLRKINAALMSRVERAMDQPSNAFSLFEAAIALDNRVRQRTAELQDALHSVERSNAALKAAKSRADQANAFKSTFLAFVGHDLLQPLNAAKLSLSALMELDASPLGASLVGQVDRALASLEDLIRTLLDLSRLEAGAMLPDVGAFEVERVIGPLRQEFGPLARARGLALTVRPSDAVVQSDPLMLRRILQNLLNNALRYTESGGVLLGCRRRGGMLRIEVVDTGPGIPDDRREAVFQEFQRDAVAGAEHGGFGLGLSIVRRLALALDHAIDLASRPGRGSRFAVSVPLAARRPGPAAAPPGYGLDSAQVLVIEDEPAVAQSMRALLERWSCRVVTAASGAEACAALRADGARPDLIIADLHLDGGELGFDAIGAVQREVAGPVPAFVLTADCSPGTAAAAAARGIELMRKPVKPAELRSLMAHLLA